MQQLRVLTIVRLFHKPFAIFYMCEEFLILPTEDCYKSIGLSVGDCWQYKGYDSKLYAGRILKLRTNALFLRLFVKECINSEVYRNNVVLHLLKLCGFPDDYTAYLKLILDPPDQEIIDYAWNERILKLLWTRVEVENAFSWLSTLGGAYSALGDYFEHCAEEAGRISIRQYRLSQMLGDDSLAERSRLYAALSLAQKGNLHTARNIVRSVADFAKATQDKRLIRMCHGVWAKLKYLRSLNKTTMIEQGKNCDTGDTNGIGV